MKEKRFIWGAVVSTIWIIVGLFLFFSFYKKPNEINQLGDFIAGFCSPLAFLWLVLGYVQQGNEIKANTQELSRQAEELAKSNDALTRQLVQQSELISLQRDQFNLQQKSIEIQQRAIEDERRRRKFQALPIFEAKHAGSSAENEAPRYYSIEVRNTGRSVSDVNFYNNANRRNLLFKEFGASQVYADTSKFYLGDYYIRITYLDLDGNPGQVRINYSMGQREIENIKVSFEEFTEPEA